MCTLEKLFLNAAFKRRLEFIPSFTKVKNVYGVTYVDIGVCYFIV